MCLIFMLDCKLNYLGYEFEFEFKFKLKFYKLIRNKKKKLMNWLRYLNSILARIPLDKDLNMSILIIPYAPKRTKHEVGLRIGSKPQPK